MQAALTRPADGYTLADAMNIATIIASDRLGLKESYAAYGLSVF